MVNGDTADNRHRDISEVPLDMGEREGPSIVRAEVIVRGASSRLAKCRVGFVESISRDIDSSQLVLCASCSHPFNLTEA